MADVLYSKTLIDVMNATEDRAAHFFEEKFFTPQVIPTPVATWDVLTRRTGEVTFAGEDGEAVPVEGDTFERKTVTLPTLRICDTITPSVLMQVLPGKTGFESEVDVAALQGLSLNKLNDTYARVREIMAANVIKTGVSSVKRPNGTTETIYSASAKTAALTGNEWNATGAEMDAGGIIQSIIAWKRQVAENGGDVPTTLLLGYQAAEYLIGQFVKQSANALAVGASADYSRYSGERIDYVGKVAGLDVYSCADTEILGAKNAIIGSAGKNRFFFGPTFIKAGDGITAVTGRQSVMSEASANPVGYINILQGSPLPVMRRPADVYYLTGVVI